MFKDFFGRRNVEERKEDQLIDADYVIRSIRTLNKDDKQKIRDIGAGNYTNHELILSDKRLNGSQAADLMRLMEKGHKLNPLQNITTLKLPKNTIGQNIVTFGKLMQKNKTLTYLDLRFNSFTSTSISVFLDYLKNNIHLLQILMEEDVDDFGFVASDTLNPITRAVAEELDKITEKNKKFKKFLDHEIDEVDLSGRRQQSVHDKLYRRYNWMATLNYSDNKISKITYEIGKLSNLTELNLYLNKIAKLPSEIADLKNLKIINLSDNKITSEVLPFSITTLPKLEQIDLSSNFLHSIPRLSYASMGSLQKIKLQDNRLTGMSLWSDSRFRNLIEADNTGQATLKALRDAQTGSEDVYRMKIMFLGNSRVGKTTITKQLTNSSNLTAEALKAPNLTKNQKPKRNVGKPEGNSNEVGVEVTTWTAPIPRAASAAKPVSTGRSIDFTVFDFAGAENYNTHGFFLTHRALYVIVFDLRSAESKTKIEYWLQSIQVRTDTAPVLLVGTHADAKLCSVDYIAAYKSKLIARYKDRFQKNGINENCFLAIDTGSKKDIDILKMKIFEVALAQEFMPHRLQRSFLALEEKLLGARQTLNPPVVAWREYSQMALDCGIQSSTIKEATKFLHTLGSLIHFEDKERGDIIIVNPQWIVTVFTSVVSGRAVFIDNGLVKRRDLTRSWTRYPEHLHNTLITILEDFGVVGKVDEEHLLIPCLLADKQPNAEVMSRTWPQFQPQDNFSGRIYNFEFLPLGFFSKLISRFLSSSGDYKTEMWWASGLILVSTDASVKLTISTDPSNKELPVCLSLWVRGEVSSRELRGFVEQIDTLAKDWLKIKYETYVPCVHCVKLGTPQPFKFPLNQIKQLITSRDKVANCTGLVPVQISKLAPDIAMADFNGVEINYTDLLIEKVIGKGGFATVYKAIWGSEIVAVKELILDSESTNESLGFEYSDAVDPLAIFDEFRQEVSLMAALDHPHLVALRGFCMEPFCMILEFMPLGSLYDFIHDREQVLNWPMIIQLADHIGKGMHFMHNFKPGQPLIHRDLKSPNVLLGVEVDADGIAQIIAKVADFGLSRNMALAPKLKNKAVDNPVWLAPEVIKNQPYDEKVDVYAYGVILWELVSRQDFLGHISFSSALEDAVLNGTRPEIPKICEDVTEYAHLIDGCWAQEPSSRPPFTKCCDVLEIVKIKWLPVCGEKMPDISVYLAKPDVKKAQINRFADGQDITSTKARIEQDLEKKLVNSTGNSADISPQENQESREIYDEISTKGNGTESQHSPLGNSHSAFQPASPLNERNSVRGTVRSSSVASFSGERTGSISFTNNSVLGRSEANWGSPRASMSTRWRTATPSRSVRSLETSGVFFSSSLPSCSAPIDKMCLVKNTVFCACADGNVFIYDKDSCLLLKNVKMHYDNISGMITVGEREVWTTGRDQQLKIWDVSGTLITAPKQIQKITCIVEVPIDSSSTKKDSSLVFMGYYDNTKKIGGVQIWDSFTKKLKKSFNIEIPAGREEAGETTNRPIPKSIIYHLKHIFIAAGIIIYCFDINGNQKGYIAPRENGHTSPINCIIPVGREIWSCGDDKLIKVWNPEDPKGACQHTFQGHLGKVIALCSDGRSCVWSCGWGKQIFLWDVKSRVFVRWLPAKHKGDNITDLLLVRNVDNIFKIWSGGDDKIINVWK